MSIVINPDICKACGMCEKVCPGSLIKLNEDRKAYIKYPKDCWGCSSCIKECKFGAIALYLGADIGGMGSLVHTESKGDVLNWIFEHYDGRVTEIPINRKESNKY